MNNSEVVVLILSTKHTIYDQFKLSIMNTWAAEMQLHGIDCIFYEGGHDNNTFDENTLRLNCGDDLASTAKKTRLAIEYITKKNPKATLIYRTNLSSYIDVKQFTNYIKTKDFDVNAYAGQVCGARYLPEYAWSSKWLHKYNKHLRFGPKFKYCSGSGLFIGKNYFEKIIASKKYDNYVDDIMIRLAIGRNPSVEDHIDRFNFIGDQDPRQNSLEFQQRIKNGLFHYRFKTENRLLDAILLEAFHDPKFKKRMCVNNCN